jgi:hypothetical protein
MTQGVCSTFHSTFLFEPPFLRFEPQHKPLQDETFRNNATQAKGKSCTAIQSRIGHDTHTEIGQGAYLTRYTALPPFGTGGAKPSPDFHKSNVLHEYQHAYTTFAYEISSCPVISETKSFFYIVSQAVRRNDGEAHSPANTLRFLPSNLSVGSATERTISR